MGHARSNSHHHYYNTPDTYSRWPRSTLRPSCRCWCAASSSRDGSHTTRLTRISRRSSRTSCPTTSRSSSVLTPKPPPPAKPPPKPAPDRTHTRARVLFSFVPPVLVEFLAVNYMSRISRLQTI